MEVFNRNCGMNQFRVRLDVGTIPVPDTSHPVAWIRRQGGGHGYHHSSLLAFTTSDTRVSFHPIAHGTTFLEARVSLTFPHIYIASELTQYPGAVERLRRHEEGHPASWQRALIDSMSTFCTMVGAEIYTVAANAGERHRFGQQFQNIARRESRIWSGIAGIMADSWDITDYPSLHSDLRALNVPAI